MSSGQWRSNSSGHFWVESWAPDPAQGSGPAARLSGVSYPTVSAGPGGQTIGTWGPQAAPESLIDQIRASRSRSIGSRLCSDASRAVVDVCAALVDRGAPQPEVIGTDPADTPVLDPDPLVTELADVTAPRLRRALSAVRCWQPAPVRAGSWMCLSRLVRAPDGAVAPMLPLPGTPVDPVQELGAHLGQLIEVVSSAVADAHAVVDAVSECRRRQPLVAVLDEALDMAGQYAVSHARQWRLAGHADRTQVHTHLRKVEVVHALAQS